MSRAEDRLKAIDRNIENAQGLVQALTEQREAVAREVAEAEANQVDGRHAWQPIPHRKVEFGKRHGTRTYTYVAIYSVGRWYVSQDGYGMGRMRGLTHSQFIDFVGKGNAIHVLDTVSTVQHTPSHRSDRGYSIDLIDRDF